MLAVAILLLIAGLMGVIMVTIMFGDTGAYRFYHYQKAGLQKKSGKNLCKEQTGRQLNNMCRQVYRRFLRKENPAAKQQARVTQRARKKSCGFFRCGGMRRV